MLVRPSRPTLLLLVLAVALATAACKKKEGAAGAAPAGPVKVTVALDDKVLTEEPTLGAPRPLAQLVTLPPLAGWIAIELVDRSGKVHAILAPAQHHAGAVPALGADQDGAVFGLLRGGKLEQRVTAVTRLTVKTRSDAGKPVTGMDHGGHGDHGGGGDSSGGGDHGTGGNSADKGVRATPTAALTIEIESAAGTATFTGDKMVGLPEIKAPTGDTETPGWNLIDVLAAAGHADVTSVTLTDEENASLKLEGADLDPAKALLYLKLNRSGVIRFRVFRKAGEVWEVGGELRGIKRIKLGA